MQRLAAAVFLVTLAFGARSAGEAGLAGQGASEKRVWLYGVGTNSCEVWTHERSGADGPLYGQWALGWVSAAGTYRDVDLVQLDGRKILDRIDKYCQDHPKDSIRQAAVALVDQLAVQVPRR